ncbi:MAG: TIGR04282 family arsenosugar biosynthesis glycosyltransferase [Solirubrobacteraceae bacterium]
MNAAAPRPAPGALVVIAKAPVAGLAKTRLCPPCTPAQAAALAEAALADTLARVLETPAERRVLVLEGSPGRWLPAGFELFAQRGSGLDERLAAAFADVGGPALIVGMDTPQMSSELLLEGLDALADPGLDAVLGPALDGGYWSLGLRRPCAEAVLGVPMSSSQTCAHQRLRLSSLGLRVHELARLRDIDAIEDAFAAAARTPGSRLASAVAGLR